MTAAYMRDAHASTANLPFVWPTRRRFNPPTPQGDNRSFKMSHTLSADRIRTIDLDHEQLLVFENRPGTRFQVLFGGLWLTEEACRDDRFAKAGESLKLHARGRAVIEAIGRSRVRVVVPARRVGAGLREWLRRWSLRPDLIAARSVAVLLALALGLGLPELLGRSLVNAGEVGQARAASSESATAEIANRA
jgi:hypothetical protein